MNSAIISLLNRPKAASSAMIDVTTLSASQSEKFFDRLGTSLPRRSTIAGIVAVDVLRRDAGIGPPIYKQSVRTAPRNLLGVKPLTVL